MFDFLDSDWFIIALEIVFVILIAYDVKNYILTKKRQYLFNIVLTLGFAVWALYPFYKSYFGWEASQKTDILKECDDANDTKLCNCVNERIFKEYLHEEYKTLDKNNSEFLEFIKDTKEDCNDSGWF